jgi:Type II CAAX prenyl endopeptidase Rce1-like
MPLHHGFVMSRHDINAAVSILGIFALGVFLIWYPMSVLEVPLPDGLVIRSAISALWQTVTVVVLPCAWAMWRLGFSLSDLGISTRKLGHALLLGCLLYSLALAAFIHCSADPLITHHAVRALPAREAVGLIAIMSLIAAGTDLATRGFILFSLARYTPVSVAILAQNFTWYLGHTNEIGLLTGCLGYAGALGLTLTLGVLGDVIALRTRNVLGLAFAHILLNILLSLYIRQL